MTKKRRTKTKKPKQASPPNKAGGDLQRLQRAMASAGFASRRECEEFIEMGRVVVDGKTVTKLGTKVDPSKQEIFVDGQRLSLERRQYFILNKPPGVVSTSKDPSGRLRVIDLIKTQQRVYNVGRLDQSSEGLILVTNDGDLANLLTHPRYGVAKKYLVQVQGVPTGEQLKSLTKGVYLAEGKARVSNIKFKKRAKDTSWLEIVLEEGRNREIRRLLARIGHKVLRLRRVSIGPLKLGELPIGAHRQLTIQEVRDLKRAVSKKPVKRRRPKKKLAMGEKTGQTRKQVKGKVTTKLAAKGTKRRKSKTSTKRDKSFRDGEKGRAAARSKTSPKSAKKKTAKKKGLSRKSRSTTKTVNRGTKKRGRK